MERHWLDFNQSKFCSKFKVSVPNASRYAKNETFRSPVQHVGQMPCVLIVYPRGSKLARPASEQDNVAAQVRVWIDRDWLPGWQFKSVHIMIGLKRDDYSDFSPVEVVSFEGPIIARAGHGCTRFGSDPDLAKIPGAMINDELHFDVAIWGNSLGYEPAKFPTCGKPFFASLWEEPRKFTDVVITTDSGATFECHRIVLASRSSVIDRMLCSAFQESATGQIVLKHIDDVIVRAMLEFMYTGHVTMEVMQGQYVVVRQGTAVSALLDPESENVAKLRKGVIVNVLEIGTCPNRIRGRVEDPSGWISIRSPYECDVQQGFVWAVPQSPPILLKLVELADMYNVPDLGIYCCAQIVKNLQEAPSHNSVRHAAQAMRKRPRTDAADELLQIVKRKICAEPDLLDALFTEDL